MDSLALSSLGQLPESLVVYLACILLGRSNACSYPHASRHAICDLLHLGQCCRRLWTIIQSPEIWDLVNLGSINRSDKIDAVLCTSKMTRAVTALRCTHPIQRFDLLPNLRELKYYCTTQHFPVPVQVCERLTALYLVLQLSDDYNRMELGDVRFPALKDMKIELQSGQLSNVHLGKGVTSLYIGRGRESWSLMPEFIGGEGMTTLILSGFMSLIQDLLPSPVTLKQWGNLRELEIAANAGELHFDEFNGLNYPSLTKITLRGGIYLTGNLLQCTSLEVFGQISPLNEEIWWQLPHIKTLHTVFANLSEIPTTEMASWGKIHKCHLQKLHLRFCNAGTASLTTTPILDGVTDLRLLTGKMTVDDMTRIGTKCGPRLQVLELVEVPNSEALIRLCPNLRTLIVAIVPGPLLEALAKSIPPTAPIASLHCSIESLSTILHHAPKSVLGHITTLRIQRRKMPALEFPSISSLTKYLPNLATIGPLNP